MVFSQENTGSYSIDASYFYGNIPRHSTSISHLITGHPEGVALSFSAKTFGAEEWEQRFNYPDYGITLIYTDLKNEYLGDNTSVYGHYSFYFLKRNLMLRLGEGLAYCSNPYDKETNYRNSAFGSTFVTSTFLQINYKKEKLIDNLGLEAGLFMIHYSNGNFKAPNTSVNVLTFNVGVTYSIAGTEQEYIKTVSDNKFTEPIKLNMVFRSGVNMSDIIGSGQYPFYVGSVYADKRLSKLSAVQLGTDVFFSKFLEEYIKYKSIAYPDEGIKGDEDYKRAGVLVGHELFMNRLSLLTQIGFYVYNPIDYESGMYQRVGLNYHINKTVFAGLTLKTHAAQAEAVEFALGVRL
ncbi:hypothetical protein NBRC110019_01540 [Neptunitalea chrysea]|uniref:Acyloxyacyl hydrolase n=2 Tax=Neptunitalea chrysea TaxID=1647581 RepID=A0A9W6B2V1_9FLAO|nr:hypothetical protein NBRC110019_01540 [Neptunitalea chrysea]